MSATKNINPLHAAGGEDIFLLNNLLNNKYWPQLDFYLSQASFEDGKATASGGTQMVKQNWQIPVHDQVVLPAIQQLITQALMEYTLLHEAFIPLRLYPLIISKYDVGMGYGWHTDSPIMGNPPIRTDLAMTLFLSEPDTYMGGELVIRGANGTMQYKLPKGDAVVYPCQYVHCVNEVQTGVRLAAVTWIQSAVRSIEQRQVLHQIKQVYNDLAAQDPHSPAANQLLQTWSNLLRMWGEI